MIDNRSLFFESDMQAAIGSVSYAPEKSAMVWKIKQLGGGKEYLMRAHFGLPSVKSGKLAATSHLTHRTARKTQQLTFVSSYPQRT